MKVVYGAVLDPWEQVGEPDVKLETRYMKAFTQGFRHPVSSAVYQFSQIEIGHYLSILPITRQGNLVITNQWKQGTKMLCPQFPGGAWSRDADPANEARAKLLAETGYSAEHVDIVSCDLHFFDSRCPNFYRVAIAIGCTHVGRPAAPDAAVIQIAEVTLAEFWAMIDRGEIHEPSAYVAVIFALRRGYLQLLPPHLSSS